MADSDLVDLWIRHGGRLKADMANVDEARQRFGRLLNEMDELGRNLQRGLQSLHEGISALRAKQASLRDLRAKVRPG